jgi:branched-chain amino acid transport system substrate-binding protein
MEYIAAYEGKYKEAASTFGGHAYDAYIIAKAAIEKAGTDKAKIRDEIEKIKNLPGPVAFSASRPMITTVSTSIPSR